MLGLELSTSLLYSMDFVWIQEKESKGSLGDEGGLIGAEGGSHGACDSVIVPSKFVDS